MIFEHWNYLKSTSYAQLCTTDLHSWTIFKNKKKKKTARALFKFFVYPGSGILVKNVFICWSQVHGWLKIKPFCWWAIQQQRFFVMFYPVHITKIVWKNQKEKYRKDNARTHPGNTMMRLECTKERRERKGQQQKNTKQYFAKWNFSLFAFCLVVGRFICFIEQVMNMNIFIQHVHFANSLSDCFFFSSISLSFSLLFLVPCENEVEFTRKKEMFFRLFAIVLILITITLLQHSGKISYLAERERRKKNIVTS